MKTVNCKQKKLFITHLQGKLKTVDAKKSSSIFPPNQDVPMYKKGLHKVQRNKELTTFRTDLIISMEVEDSELSPIAFTIPLAERPSAILRNYLPTRSMLSEIW